MELIKKVGNLRDSIPIDEKYYILSQIEFFNIYAEQPIFVSAEFQAINNGLKKGDFAIFVTSMVKTSKDKNAVFSKEDNNFMITLCENLGDNIVNRKDHYGQICRVGGITFGRNYDKLYINLWVKSGSTQASKGDLCYFRPNTTLMVWR